MNEQDLCQFGRTVIQQEAQAVQALLPYIDHRFAQTCQWLLNCSGRIAVLGIGKSGHIGHKIAATLASTGSPAFFVHAAEACHGDLGMLTSQDVVLAISYSGESEELISLLPILKDLNIPLIALTGYIHSRLAKQATIVLPVTVAQEACPLGLTPTASTTATLAMGDALAIALLEARGFTRGDFTKIHPKGRLGRILLPVSAIMHSGSHMPQVKHNTVLSDALLEMSCKRLGMTVIIDTENKLSGVFTDGDLRRILDHDIDLHNTLIEHVMTRDCKTILATQLASEALQIMETHKITALVVIDTEQRPIGIVHIHDLLTRGIGY